jgi:alpha-beta hydrolase superfamily lysophospholipase
VDSLYLAGFSTGGLLSLQAALSNPGVRGLILFSPALKIKSRLAFLSGMARYLRTWLEVAPDEDYAKYESFTTHAAYQIYRLTEEVSELRSSTRLVAPLFIALSADDATTESKETLTYFLRQGHPAGRLILYANNAPPDTNPRVRVVRSAHAEENILEQSHISTGIAPENPHYGRTGDYRNCKHYLYDRDAWDACKQARFIPKGERGAGKPPGTVFARLTYNPDFRNLTRELGQFLDRVETP